MKDSVLKIRDEVADLPLNDRIKLIQSLVQDVAQRDEIDDSTELNQVAAILKERLEGPSEVVEDMGSWTRSILNRFKIKTSDLMKSSRHG